MFGKPKYKWQQRKERSVFEIVSNDGAMRPKEILYIVQQLCRILEGQGAEGLPLAGDYIHPQTILIRANGTVRLAAASLPLSAREAYIPPEQGQFDDSTPASIAYALGMAMLFMATGHERKIDLEVFVGDGALRSLIARCTAFDSRMRIQSIAELSDAVKRARTSAKKVLFILLISVCACAAAALIFWLYQRGSARGETAGKEAGYRAGYVSGYEKGYEDAPALAIGGASFDPETGNFSGNLAMDNGAILACSEEEIFFLHEGNIYRMDPYTQNTRVLAANAGAHGLNYYGGWLYYCTNEQVRRIQPETMKDEAFCDSRTGLLYIADGGFYLHDVDGTGYLYSINEHAGTLTQLNDMTEYHCLNIAGGRLYFVDVQKGHNIYCCDLDGGNLRLINSNYCESFCVYDGKIYAYAASFSGGAINYSASFLLCTDLDGGDIESFTNIPAYYPNVTDGGIFYIAGNNRTLEWMSHNGRTRYTILSTRTSVFNIAGRWIFYLNEEDGSSLWRVRIDGSDNTKVMPS